MAILAMSMGWKPMPQRRDTRVFAIHRWIAGGDTRATVSDAVEPAANFELRHHPKPNFLASPRLLM